MQGALTCLSDGHVLYVAMQTFVTRDLIFSVVHQKLILSSFGWEKVLTPNAERVRRCVFSMTRPGRST